MEDKRVCPHCGERLHEGDYLMSVRRGEGFVLSPWWLLVLGVLALIAGVAILRF